MLILHAQCTVEQPCSNRYDLVDCKDPIPVLKLNIQKDPSIIRDEMNKMYGFDLCEKCSLVPFKLPFDIEEKQGHVKVFADFDSPFCSNCPLSMSVRHHFSIKINRNNKLLVDGELTQKDSLRTKIINYLRTIGYDKNAPETFEELHFAIYWQPESSPIFFNEILTILYKSYLSFVEQELNKAEFTFCRLESNMIAQVRQKYPLIIELAFPKAQGIIAPDLANLETPR